MADNVDVHFVVLSLAFSLLHQDSQSIEDEQLHLLNGSIHEEINQVDLMTLFFTFPEGNSLYFWFWEEDEGLSLETSNREDRCLKTLDEFCWDFEYAWLCQEARERRRSGLKELPPIQSRSFLDMSMSMMLWFCEMTLACTRLWDSPICRSAPPLPEDF